MSDRFTEEIANQIVGARRCGCALRTAAKAAGVAWQTFIQWRRYGRAVNRQDPTARPGWEKFAKFAADLDAADARYERSLHESVSLASIHDGRLALDMLKRREGWRHRRELERLELLKHQKEIELLNMKIAAGGVDQHQHTVNARVCELPSLEPVPEKPSHMDPEQGTTDEVSGVERE